MFFLCLLSCLSYILHPRKSKRHYEYKNMFVHFSKHFLRCMIYVETPTFLFSLFLIYSSPKVENILPLQAKKIHNKISSVYGEVSVKSNINILHFMLCIYYELNKQIHICNYSVLKNIIKIQCNK